MDTPPVSPRSHPATVVSIVFAAIAVIACALVAIAYMLGWIPAKNVVTATPTSSPARPASIAPPGVDVAGSAPGVVLLPGETLVAPAEAARVPAAEFSKSEPSGTPRPTTPRYSKAPQTEPMKPAAEAPKKPPSPIYSQPVPAPSTTTYAKVLPSRAAPSKPDYNRADAPNTSNERSSRNLCINCGVITSIGSSGGDWEVRVRFEDGSSETLRYPERPRLRIGERVQLEGGRLLPE